MKYSHTIPSTHALCMTTGQTHTLALYLPLPARSRCLALIQRSRLRFHPTMEEGGDMTAACEGSTRKVMTMEDLGVGHLLREVDLGWDSLGDLRRTSYGHLQITFPDDIMERTQYWDAVKILGGLPIIDHSKTDLDQDPSGTKMTMPKLPKDVHTYADGDFFIASR